MKFIALLCLCCQCSFASTWTFHAAKGICVLDVHWNNWTYSDTYGVSSGSWLIPADGWFVSDGGPNDQTFQSGNTITVVAPYFGTTLTAWTFYSLNQIGGEVAISDSGGEFWLDLGPDGLPRVSNSVLLDFGEWLSDGSINPDYVAPMVVKKHRKK